MASTVARAQVAASVKTTFNGRLVKDEKEEGGVARNGT